MPTPRGCASRRKRSGQGMGSWGPKVFSFSCSALECPEPIAVTAGGFVRGKDAVVASMLICEMARWHRARGMGLADAMGEL